MDLRFHEFPGSMFEVFVFCWFWFFFGNHLKLVTFCSCWDYPADLALKAEPLPGLKYHEDCACSVVELLKGRFLVAYHCCMAKC